MVMFTFTLSLSTCRFWPVLRDNANMNAMTNTATAVPTVSPGFRKAVLSSVEYICSGRSCMDIFLKNTLLPPPPRSIMAAVAIGMNDTATRSENISVDMIEKPMFRPRSFIIGSSENTNGRNTVMVVSVDAIRALRTSFTPCRAANRGGMPIEARRYMFSSTTILLSSSMPMANAIPIRVSVFMDISAA